MWELISWKGELKTSVMPVSTSSCSSETRLLKLSPTPRCRSLRNSEMRLSNTFATTPSTIALTSCESAMGMPIRCIFQQRYRFSSGVEVKLLGIWGLLGVFAIVSIRYLTRGASNVTEVTLPAKQLLHDNFALHVVVSGTADNRAFHLVFARLIGLEVDQGRFPFLDGLVDAQFFDFKTMLDVAGRNLQRHILALFYVNDRRLKRITAGRNLNMNWFRLGLPVAPRQEHTYQ